MTQELATRANGAGSSLVRFSADEIETIRSMVASGLTDPELRVFVARCEHTGLDPLANQICAVKRWDGRQQREVMTIQVTIDGLRSKAAETGDYDGQDPPQWCGSDGKWRDVWLSDEPPAAAKVTIYRRGMTRPIIGITTYKAYVQKTKDGKPASRWLTDPAGMLAKTAEAQAFRRGFPQVLRALVGDGVLLEDDGPTDDMAEWRRLWFKTVRGTLLDSADARAAFVRSYTNNETDSLAEFLARSSDEERAELIQAAAAFIAKSEPQRVIPRNEREQADVDEFYARQADAEARRAARTPEERAAGARTHTEIFGSDAESTAATVSDVQPEPTEPIDDPWSEPAQAAAEAQPTLIPADTSDYYSDFKRRFEALAYGDAEHYEAIVDALNGLIRERKITPGARAELAKIQATTKQRIFG